MVPFPSLPREVARSIALDSISDTPSDKQYGIAFEELLNGFGRIAQPDEPQLLEEISTEEMPRASAMLAVVLWGYPIIAVADTLASGATPTPQLPFLYTRS
jgi:hypothetical protein